MPHGLPSVDAPLREIDDDIPPKSDEDIDPSPGQHDVLLFDASLSERDDIMPPEGDILIGLGPVRQILPSYEAPTTETYNENPPRDGTTDPRPIRRHSTVESPETASQSSSQLRRLKLATPETFKKPPRKRSMLRELQAFNKPPNSSKRVTIDVATDFNDMPFKITRQKTHVIAKWLKNQDLSPRVSLDETKLEKDQLRKERGTKRFYPTEKSDLSKPTAKERKMDHVSTKTNIELSSSSTLRNNRRRTYEQEDGLVQASGAISMVHEIGARNAWREWEKQKSQYLSRPTRSITYSSSTYTIAETVIELIHTPEYDPQPAWSERQRAGRSKEYDKPYYSPVVDKPKDTEFHMEGDLYVFEPSSDAFSRFGVFLKAVENMVGRKRGVVKIVVPQKR